MNDTTSDAARIFAPLWKRKWLILLVGLAVGAATYEYYKHQPATYTAKTSLYLGGTQEQQAPSSGSAQAKTINGRELTNQVELINSTIVAGPVRRGLRAGHDVAAAKGKAKATASATSSFITITTEARTPGAAKALANAYAKVYIARQRANYFKSLRTAITNAREQLRRIETPAPTSGKGGKSSGNASSAIQAATLASKVNQLESSLASFSAVQQVSPAKASLLPLSPTPKKNAIFGFVLGLLVAAVAAYALSQFDRRLSSLSDVEGIFHAQMLTALPKVKSPVVRPNGERAPARPLLEPLRRLHTTLQFGDVFGRDGAPRSIAFLSADPGDGRSTLVANLACVQRDAGARVAVIEADFRRPVMGRLLDVTATYGLADVLAGTIPLEDAMQRVDAPVPAGGPSVDGTVAGVSTAVAAPSTGALSVLLGGEHVENPPALLASEAMGELVRSVACDYDYVLIDAPPQLSVSDVLPLLTVVDGAIIVARVGHTREQSAQRLTQLLERTASAPLLGVVANCVTQKDIARYGFSRAATAQRRPRTLFGR